MSEGVLSMNVNFEYYRIFYYVAKYHNFTKAAHTLGSSQPNVTRAMNCLEQSYRIVRGCHMEALRSVSARPH